MTNNYYIAEDGTIHKTPVSGNHAEQSNRCLERNIPAHHNVSWIRCGIFWIVTILFAAGIGYASYQNIGIEHFGRVAEGRDTFDNFIAYVVPYVMIIGAILGAIIYGVGFACDSDYNLGTYLFSGISSLLGMGAGIALLYVASFVLIACFYVVIIAILISVIVAIFGGS